MLRLPAIVLPIGVIGVCCGAADLSFPPPPPPPPIAAPVAAPPPTPVSTLPAATSDVAASVIALRPLGAACELVEIPAFAEANPPVAGSALPAASTAIAAAAPADAPPAPAAPVAPPAEPPPPSPPIGIDYGPLACTADFSVSTLGADRLIGTDTGAWVAHDGTIRRYGKGNFLAGMLRYETNGQMVYAFPAVTATTAKSDGYHLAFLGKDTVVPVETGVRGGVLVDIRVYSRGGWSSDHQKAFPIRASGDPLDDALEDWAIFAPYYSTLTNSPALTPLTAAEVVGLSPLKWFGIRAPFGVACGGSNADCLPQIRHEKGWKELTGTGWSGHVQAAGSWLAFNPVSNDAHGQGGGGLIYDARTGEIQGKEPNHVVLIPGP